MLDQDQADRRQLTDVMATEPPAWPPLIRRELAATTTAGDGIMIDDLIHLVLGSELATRAPVTRLPARLALPAQSSLATSRTTLATSRTTRNFIVSDGAGLGATEVRCDRRSLIATSFRELRSKPRVVYSAFAINTTMRMNIAA
jgi:hypothetical protein